MNNNLENNQNPILPNQPNNIGQTNTNNTTEVPKILNNNFNLTNNYNNTIPNSLNENINNQNNISQNISINPVNNNITTNINNTENDDEELLKSFIGKNYEKITTKSFNFPGFFFNSFYMFYRKMFGLGFLSSIIISLILSLVLNFIKLDNEILNIIIYIIAYLIIGCIIGLTVNKLYINYSKKKINKIKNSNQGKTTEELKNICIKSGGTSVGQIFLGFATVLITIIILMLILSLFLFKTLFSNMFPFFNNNMNYNDIPENGEYNDNEYDPDEEYNRYIELAADGNYDGMLYFDSDVDVTNEFTVNVPSIFENELYDTSYQYSYENQEETVSIFKTCSLSINALLGYKNAELLINNMANFYKEYGDETSDVTINTINNINWYSFHKTDTIGKTYYYGTTKNDKVFLFEYDINEAADNKCEGYLEQIINSVESK